MFKSIKPLKLHVQLWKMFGIWHWPGQPLKYTIYSVCLITIIGIIYPFFFIMRLIYAKDLNDIIEAFSFLPTSLIGVRLWVLLRKKTSILRILKLSKQMVQQVAMGDEQAVNNQSDRLCYNLLRAVLIIYNSTTVLFYVDGLIADYPKLLCAIWFPYEFKDRNVLYHLTIFGQFLIGVFLGSTLATLDTFGATMYQFLQGHLHILGMRLQALGKINTQQPMGGIRKKKPLAIFEVERNACLSQNHMDLKKCVLYHLICNEFVNEIDEIMSASYILQFATTGTLMCGNLYKLSKMNPTVELSNFTSCGVYTICAAVQLLVPCFWASQLTEKSEQLTRCIFNSNWIEQSHSFKSTMMIFVERSLDPIVPKAGGLFDVGLPIFVSIVKAGYSMSTFMNEME